MKVTTPKEVYESLSPDDKDKLGAAAHAGHREWALENPGAMIPKQSYEDLTHAQQEGYINQAMHVVACLFTAEEEGDYDSEN